MNLDDDDITTMGANIGAGIPPFAPNTAERGRPSLGAMKAPIHKPRSVGLGMCIAGLVLWIVALVVDAPTLSVILSILILMGGAVMLTVAKS